MPAALCWRPMPDCKLALWLTIWAGLTAFVGPRAIPGADIAPPNPVPLHSLVTVRYGDGDSVAVVRIVDGLPVDVPVLDCGNGTLAFTGPAGAYLLGAVESGRLRFYVVRIAAGPPGPDPPPPPPPGPDPPDSPLGLTKWTAARVAAMPEADRPAAAAIAANYRWGADELIRRTARAPGRREVCANGACRVYVPDSTVKTIYEAVAVDVRDRNRTASAAPAWVEFGQDLHAKLNELRRTVPAVRTLEGYRAALLEIAVGLEWTK